MWAAQSNKNELCDTNPRRLPRWNTVPPSTSVEQSIEGRPVGLQVPWTAFPSAHAAAEQIGRAWAGWEG